SSDGRTSAILPRRTPTWIRSGKSRRFASWSASESRERRAPVHARQRPVQRPRHPTEIESLDQQPCVADLPAAAAAHEAPQLLPGLATAPFGLLLQCAKRSHVALSGNDRFH